MFRFGLVPFLLTAVLLASCASPVTTSPATAPATPPATQTLPLPASSATPTPAVTPTQPPQPSATPAVSPIRLGQPAWAGRGQILDAGFLPDGLGVVVGWASGISLSDLATGKEKWYVQAPAPLIKLDVQPQGRFAAAGFTDGSLLVVDTASGQARRFAGKDKPTPLVGSVAWSPDGKTVAYQFIGAYRGDPIFLLDAATGSLSQVPDSAIDSGILPRLVWSPDGKTISLAGLGTVCPKLLDVTTGKVVMTLTQAGACDPGSYPTQIAAWTPDGRAVVGVSPSGDIVLVSFPDGKVLQTFKANGPVTAHPSSGRAVVFDPSGKWLANRSGIAEYYFAAIEPITVWDAASGTAKAHLEHPVTTNKLFYRLAASFQGDSLLMLYSDGSVTRWNFTLEKAERQLFRLAIPAAELWTLRWSQDSQRLVYIGSSGGVFVYDADSGQAVAQVDGALDSPGLNPDGSQLAFFDRQKKEVRVVDVASGKVLLRLPGASLLGGVAFSPDGSFLAYSQGTNAAVAELATGKTLALQPSAESAPLQGEPVTHLVWSPDGEALVVAAAGNGDDQAGKDVLWQIGDTGAFKELTWVDDYQAGYPMGVAAVFNPSGTRVALRKEPKNEAGYIELLIYDLEQQKIIQDLKDYFPGMWVDDNIFLMRQAAYFTWTTRLDVTSGQITEGRGTDVMGNAYAPGGVYFAHPDEDGLGIILSDWSTGAILARGQHGDSISDLSWSPDGNRIASVGVLGTVRIWPVNYR